MTYTLNAELRTSKGEKVRYEGQLPAIIYGAGSTSESLSLNPQEFLKLYKDAGESSLIDLVLGGKEAGKVLVQDVQVDPVTNRVLHVDLRRIDMNKEMTAPVTLRFVGEPPIIKSSGGTLVASISIVEVKCLPKDLVSHIDVDLSKLESYEQVIKVKDLVLPSGIQVVSPNQEDLVAKAARALTEDEIKAMESSATEQVDLSKIEVAGKKKEEEGAEGEAEAAPKAEEKK